MPDLSPPEDVVREWIARASHELRTPVTAISGATQTLLGPHFRLDPEVRSFIGIVGRACEQLTSQIDALAMLARLGSGAYELEIFEQDLATATSSALRQIKARADERRISLAGDCPAGLRVLADWRATEQMLAALFDNALRRTNDRGCVTMSTARLNGSVEISVLDNGPRLTPGQLSNPFAFLLGLAVAQRLALVQRGSAGAENVSGGARFWIRLPAR